MKVLVVTNDYPPRPGGIQQWLGNLVDAFEGEVRVLAPADAPATNTRGEDIVVRDRRKWMLPTRRIRRWITSQVEEFGPDVVFYAAPHPLTFLARRIKEATGVPYAVMTHGAEVTLPAAVPGLRQLMAGPLRSADAVFAVSDYTGSRVAQLARKPVTTIGAGVDLERFTPREDRSATPLVVGCVSRFVPRKGQKRVLEAARRLRSSGHDVQVALVGKGRNETMLRRTAERWAVPTRFHVDVPWHELPALYQTFDVFAMPCRSRWLGLEVEGLGIVFLEASASGLPVVAGRSGGAPETVDEGVTGHVVDSVSDLVAVIERLLDDPQVRREMGAAGRMAVTSRWTWAAVAERFTAGLESVVDTR